MTQEVEYLVRTSVTPLESETRIWLTFGVIEQQEAEDGENKTVQNMLFFPLNKSCILQFHIVSFSHLTM